MQLPRNVYNRHTKYVTATQAIQLDTRYITATQGMQLPRNVYNRHTKYITATQAIKLDTRYITATQSIQLPHKVYIQLRHKRYNCDTRLKQTQKYNKCGNLPIDIDSRSLPMYLRVQSPCRTQPDSVGNPVGGQNSPLSSQSAVTAKTGVDQ